MRATVTYVNDGQVRVTVTGDRYPQTLDGIHYDLTAGDIVNVRLDRAGLVRHVAAVALRPNMPKV